MKIVTSENKVSVSELKEMAKKMFGNFINVVVDVEKEVMAVGGELHAEGFASLLDGTDSDPENLWGINIYPNKAGEDFVEFDSVANIKPSQGNDGRGIDNPELRKTILEIVNKLIDKK